jgi:hypothetical protein
VRAADMRLLLDFLYTGQAYVQVRTRFWEKTAHKHPHWSPVPCFIQNSFDLQFLFEVSDPKD